MIHIAAQDTQSNLTNVELTDIQPNAVDLRVDKIFHINFIKPFVLQRHL